MNANLKIIVRTNKYPISVYFYLKNKNKNIFINCSNTFNTKIDSYTLWNDFMMTNLRFECKRDKIKNLEDFDFECFFILRTKVNENNYNNLYNLYKEFLTLNDNCKDDLYKWIKKTLSNMR